MKTLALNRFQILNLIIFALILAYFNFTVDFNYGDDIWASSQTLSVDGAIGLYRSWSGRVIAYVFQIFLIHNTVLFRILNTMIMLGMPITVWMLVDRNKKLGNLTLIVLLFMLYDYREMRTAGLVTTYITYYWTLFFNILFYLSAGHYFKSGRTVSFSLAIALITGIIACNSELGALVNTLIFFVQCVLSSLLVSPCSIRIDGPDGTENVKVRIGDAAFWIGHMNCEIADHAPADELLLQESPRQGDVFFHGQFVLQSYVIAVS